MDSPYAIFALAFALGLVLALGLLWAMPRARLARVAILVLIPPAVLLAYFLAFFQWAPEAEDWFWLGVGFVQFWPYYLAFGLGGVVASLGWARVRRARG